MQNTSQHHNHLILQKMHLSDSTNAIIGTSVAQQAEKCVQDGLLCFTPTLHTYNGYIYTYI